MMQWSTRFLLIVYFVITGCVCTGTDSKTTNWNKLVPIDRQVVAIEERHLDGDVPQMIIRTERKTSLIILKENPKPTNTEDKKEPLFIIFQ